jgi:hypothetical protein
MIAKDFDQPLGFDSAGTVGELLHFDWDLMATHQSLLGRLI